MHHTSCHDNNTYLIWDKERVNIRKPDTELVEEDEWRDLLCLKRERFIDLILLEDELDLRLTNVLNVDSAVSDRVQNYLVMGR